MINSKLLENKILKRLTFSCHCVEPAHVATRNLRACVSETSTNTEPTSELHRDAYLRNRLHILHCAQGSAVPEGDRCVRLLPCALRTRSQARL